LAYNPFYNIENPELLGYEYAWVNFVKDGTIPYGIVPEEIIKSWKRCRKAGVDPTGKIQRRRDVGREETAAIIAKHRQLMDASQFIMEDMRDIFEQDSFQVWIADPDSNILMSYSKHEKLNDRLIGTRDSESYIGTNSIDMALRLQRPVSVIGAQHYCQAFHKYANYAAPIIVHENTIIGVIGMRVACEDMNDFMLAMIAVTARAIENRYTLLKNSELVKKENIEKQRVLDWVTNGVLYVDDNQMVTFANQKMINMTGLQKDEIINHPIYVIETLPSMEAIDKGEADGDVKLIGKKEEFSCLLERERVSGGYEGESDSDSKNHMVWIFTPIEDIQEIADKVGSTNRAFFTFDNIIGETKKMRETVTLAKKVADYDARVILEGESGTGKEIIAQSIHNAGKRKNGPFVAIDCGAIPRELIESEMFGYEEGAFTGARKGGARGKFEIANKGTLFLDEIGNLPLDMQVKLLRALQENTIVRVGGTKSIPFDAQIIAATNIDLKDEIENGSFREDLFYRLNIVHIKIPPLRERKEDIPLIVDKYIRANSRNMKKNIKGVSTDVMDVLLDFDWPGNVRQLDNVIERMMILSEEEIMTLDNVPAEIKAPKVPESMDLSKRDKVYALSEMASSYVKGVVDKYDGNIKKASEKLDISRATVYRYLNKQVK